MSAPTPETGLSMTPYPGLRPFRRDETDIFFGREEQVDQLLDKLTQQRFLGVVGASGCGKSSLVRAGMISAMEAGFMASAGARWCYATLRPGGGPIGNLAEALLESGLLDKWSDDESSVSLLTAALRRGPRGLIELLQEAPLPADTNLLVLVDQFEEIFRFHALGDSAEAAAFVKLLLATAAEPDLPVYVVITMRSDFLGDCAVFTGLPEALNQGQFLTPRMSREQLKAAVMGPAAIFGGEVEPELVNRILNDMGTDPDQLPLMQHALSRAWTRESHSSQRIDATKMTITHDRVTQDLTIAHAEFQKLGGLSRALSNHADEAFDELSPADQYVAEVLFRCLSERSVGQRDTRRPVALGTVAQVAGVSVEDMIRVVEVFRHPDRSFLMPPDGVPLSADTVIDISHESLIRQWTRMKGWVEKESESARNYRRLQETARLWKEGRAGLWGTPDLENALAWRDREQPTAAWAERYGGGLELAMRFLDESVAAKEEREREERRNQQRAQNLMVMTVISALVTVIAVGALTWGIRARMASRRAEAKSRAILQVSRQTGETLAESRDLGVEETKRGLKQAVDDFSDFVALRGSPRDLRELQAITNFNTANTSESRIAISDRVAFYSKAVKIQRQLLQDAPETKLKEDLAFTLNKTGAVYLESERWEEAEKSFNEAIALRQELVKTCSDDDPQKKVSLNRLLASSIMNLGVLEARRDDPELALAKYERADSIRQEFLASGDSRLLMDYADSQLNVALLHLKLVTKNSAVSQIKAANARIRESQQISETLLNKDRESPDYQHLLAKTHLRESETLEKTAVFEWKLEQDMGSAEISFNAAVSNAETARKIIDPLVSKFPSVRAFSETRSSIQGAIDGIKSNLDGFNAERVDTSVAK